MSDSRERKAFGPRGSRIVGLGHAQPRRVVTNDELATMVDTDDAWVRSRTGIQTRHIAGEGESATTLAVDATRMALADAGVEPGAVDLVVVASTTTDSQCPNTAGRVAQALGMAGPAVLDINTACSGFEYAVAIADQAMRAGTAHRAVVVGAETLSTVTDWEDRTTAVLVADGAGAMVLEASEPGRVSDVVWGSVPELADAVRFEGEPERFHQEGRSVFRWATTGAAQHAKRVVEAAGLTVDDIEVVALHQANLRIIEPIVEQLGLADRVVIRDVVESGNTSAASVPLGLSKAWHRGELPSGATALLFGFGGGFTYAGLVAVLP